MPRLKSGTIIPLEEEDSAIAEAAMADPDARPLTDAEWNAVKSEVRLGRAESGVRKVSATIRFDADVLEAMKATGPGWQTRINEIVRAYVRSRQ